MKSLPLIYEHVEDERNWYFLTLIEHRKNKSLVVIDNVIWNRFDAYVLDYLDAYQIDVTWFLEVVTNWYHNSSDKHPLSFELSKLGHPDVTQKLRRNFDANTLSRCIGKIFVFDYNASPTVKSRRAKFIEDMPVPLSKTKKKRGRLKAEKQSVEIQETANSTPAG